MALTRKKIWTINISISATTLLILFFFSTEILSSIYNFLLSINRPLGFSSTNILDGIILSLIPIWSYFLYSSKTTILLRNILIANIATLFSIVATCVTAFILCAMFVKPISPFIPDYVVNTPFPNFFWTVMFLIGVAIPHLIHKIAR